MMSRSKGPRHYFADEEPETDSISWEYLSDAGCRFCGQSSHSLPECPHTPIKTK